ncbi:MAG TPA: hypothetical protein DCE41_01025 [Cytophagales bacterium]|nr:hypothetical protein [Cytophagales bacterium]
MGGIFLAMSWPQLLLAQKSFDAELLKMLGDNGSCLMLKTAEHGSAQQAEATLHGVDLAWENQATHLSISSLEGQAAGLVIKEGLLTVTLPQGATRGTLEIFRIPNGPEMTAIAYDLEGNSLQTIDVYWEKGMGIFDFYAETPQVKVITLQASGTGAVLQTVCWE